MEISKLEKVIKGLPCLAGVPIYCETCPYSDEFGFGYGNRRCAKECASDALELLKEQNAVDPKQGEWIYCEDESGQDGYKCSECGFFEPWYYDFENHNFITDYAYCPSCGKQMQEGR